MTVYYDGKPVGHNPCSALDLRLTFQVVENEKPVRYDARAWDFTSYRRWKAAILRNAKFIYNEGLALFPGSETMRDIKTDLKAKGIEPEQEIEHCASCGAENIILDPFFCACCGAILASPSEISASSIVKDIRSKNMRTCFVCNGGLLEDSKKGKPAAWCPFCGKLAHADCLVDALKDEPKCPSCGNTLLEQDLKNQLKKRKNK